MTRLTRHEGVTTTQDNEASASAHPAERTTIRTGKRGNNEGSITRRADGRWQARVSLDAGNRKYFYGKTRQEVAAQLTAALRDRDQGLPLVADERQTLAQYLDSWLATMRSTVRPRTWQRYEQYVRLHTRPLLGKVALTKLTAQQVQGLYANRLEAGCSPTSVKHLHTVLHKALEDALRLGLVQRNVVDLVRAPRMWRVEMRVLSLEQVRTLLSVARGDRFKALYVLAVTTGMRRGELLALKWRDVDLGQGSGGASGTHTSGQPALQVRATLQKTRGRICLRRAEVGAQSSAYRAHGGCGRGAPHAPSAASRGAVAGRAGMGGARSRVLHPSGTPVDWFERAQSELSPAAEESWVATYPLSRPTSHGGDAAAVARCPSEGGE